MRRAAGGVRRLLDASDELARDVHAPERVVAVLAEEVVPLVDGVALADRVEELLRRLVRRDVQRLAWGEGTG